MSLDLVAGSVTKKFNTEAGAYVHALNDISLEVERGQFFVLVGDSGSGKTTLLRCIAGLEKPDKGRIQLRDKTVFSASDGIYVPPQERGVGMVFQSYAIWPHLTVYQNVALPLRRGRYRLPAGEIIKRVHDALSVVGLSGLDDRPAPNLSGGQQQRVALARAIAVSSDMLLMDEPLSNLDARLREEVRSQIKIIAKQFETTVIYVTHDQVEALALADRMALMRDGHILQEGTPEELYERSASRVIAEFFGPMNFFEGEVVGKNLIKTEVGVLTVSDEIRQSRKVLVGLRPEKIRLSVSGQGDTNSFEGKIINRVFLGGRMVYEVEVKNIKLRVEAMTSYPVGQSVATQLPADSLRLFTNGS